MKIILHILRKEFIQIFRNKTMLPIIFIMPLLQLIILVHAATLEMKRIEMVVVDMDLSSTSRELTNKFKGSPFFVINGYSFSLDEAKNELKSGNTDLILYIPHNFEGKLTRENETKLQILIDAINGTVAGLSQVYCLSIIRDFNRGILAEMVSVSNPDRLKTIDIETSYWYNPELNYKIYMLPGILVILVTVIGMFLSAINLVREKEIGTIEQINVTPIKKYQFIIGKLLPFWVIALVELGFGLFVGKVFFHIPMIGNLGLLFGFASIYLLAVMGFGLLISALSNTQQQVMFLAFFFLLTFIMMSGIFTSVETMPKWAQTVNILNPFAYFMRVIRMVLLKGSGFSDISREIYYLSVYAAIMLSLATWRYKKVA